MRIGILGGTFNPVHIGHRELAVKAYKELKLDKVYVIPSGNPPYKQKDIIVSGQHRLNMLKLAFKDLPFVKLQSCELERTGNTYTVDTINTLTLAEPDNEFFLILGKDAYDRFPLWKGSVTIRRQCMPIGFERTFISSDEIRERIGCGMPLEGFLSPDVIRYINDNGLYADRQIEALKAQLRSKLTPHRYEHTLGVAATAFSLAVNNGYDPHRAYLAGLLHDCAKHLDADTIRQEAIRFGEALSPQEIKYSCNLLHSKVGAYYSASEYGIDDKEIFDAIYYHTTGRPEMTLLDRIIYVSDIIEPGRNMDFNPGLDTLRKIAKQDLDEAVRLIVLHTTEYLISQYGNDIAGLTLTVYEHYKQKTTERINGKD